MWFTRRLSRPYRHHRPAAEVRLSRTWQALRGSECWHRDRRSAPAEHTYMLVLHAHEMERRAWVSTDAREAIPTLGPLRDDETRHAMFVHDNDLVSALLSDD